VIGASKGSGVRTDCVQWFTKSRNPFTPLQATAGNGMAERGPIHGQ